MNMTLFYCQYLMTIVTIVAIPLLLWYVRKDRFQGTIALGRIKKLMEWPCGGDIKRRRLLRRADTIESCIHAVIGE